MTFMLKHQQAILETPFCPRLLPSTPSAPAHSDELKERLSPLLPSLDTVLRLVHPTVAAVIRCWQGPRHLQFALSDVALRMQVRRSPF